MTTYAVRPLENPNYTGLFAYDSAGESCVYSFPSRDRDALTAAFDAPRLAARETPEVVARNDNGTTYDIALVRTAFEWGIGSASLLGDSVDWITGPDAERQARARYAAERGKALCVCGAECDEEEIDRSDDEPMCPKCVAATVEHWRTADVVCMAGVWVPEAHAHAPGGCGWSGKGAEANVSDGEPVCPRCGGGVEESDPAPLGEIAPHPPRYVVGTVDAAPDGTLVAVLLGDGVGIADACREFNRDQSAADEVTWRRPADGFCSDLPLDTPCIIDTAASQEGG